jgi:Ca-activated chloride channel family protein
MLDSFQFRVLNPEMSAGLLLVPLLAWFYYLNLRAKRCFRIQAGYSVTVKKLSRFSSGKEDWLLLVCLIVASSCLMLSLMRPQFYVEKEEPEYEKQDLVLILDRSLSMQARDVTPSRFSRAIREIKGFLANKPDIVDRVGLVGFAGTAVVLSHLTRDLETLFFFLDWISEDAEPYYGTNISGAIASALEMAQDDDSPGGDIFLLLSDGDDESTGLPDYLDRLKDAGIRVHTIGIGSSESVPIPLAGTGEDTMYLQGEDGNQLTTRFDESTLRKVASMTHGSFFRSETGHDLAGALKEVVQQEQKQVGWKSSVDFVDLYVPLLIATCISTFFLFIKT